MRLNVKSVVLCVSLAVNVLFLCFIFLALSQKTSSLSFYDPGDRYFHAAAVAGVPEDSTAVLFNAVEITLRPGQTASLQFSAVSSRRQANFLIQALYDHTVIAVSHTGFGILITALAPGETVMQSLWEDGFRDLARVRVSE